LNEVVEGGMAAKPRSSAEQQAALGLLSARPTPPESREMKAEGTHRLRLGTDRDGILFVPPESDPSRPAPLLIMLHGAGGTAEQVIPMVQPPANQRGVVVLAPDSRDRRSWDLIRGGYGPDIRFLDEALTLVFRQRAILPDRIAIAGFSDGASYALSLALINGLLFRAALAFSPGFAAPTTTGGHPRIFISHGTRDDVLPIERCGRALARKFRQTGYDVTYDEFEGGHVVPPTSVETAFGVFLDRPNPP
jgi:predicted esterase